MSIAEPSTPQPPSLRATLRPATTEGSRVIWPYVGIIVGFHLRLCWASFLAV